MTGLNNLYLKKSLICPERDIRIEDLDFFSLWICRPDFDTVGFVTRFVRAAQGYGLSLVQGFFHHAGYHDTVRSGYCDIDLLDEVEPFTSLAADNDMGIPCLTIGRDLHLDIPVFRQGLGWPGCQRNGC